LEIGTRTFASQSATGVSRPVQRPVLTVPRSGRFWQEESFDHLVRSLDQFEAIQRYIAKNPVVAGLLDGQFLNYRFGDQDLKARILAP
jgi:hypothetical protein